MTDQPNFNPPNHDTFSPTYSHISRIPISSSHTLVSFAGQIGHDSTTDSIPATLGEQCTLAFANVDKCLEAAGATKRDIIQVRQYVVNLLRGGQGQDPERTKRYLAWIGEHRPPSTLLGVEALANEKLVYEIEIVCLVKST
ncbi:Endoribonuclease L-PSP/chorismate mutase-like protein [Pyrenochaeta sp. MPI-SDFR-AT-0127]|nr:Endoribonuclease L-PSP/chorismate mutase-like protein [Pyrenochaeta sp. MPI-SDFR-AT-0127]